MIDAARAAGTLLSVGYNQRYFPALKVVRDFVQSGEIGRLSHVRAYAGHVGLAEFKAPWMYDAAVMGGGALMDNGTHLVDLVRYVMGDPTEVYGQALHRVWGLDVEDEAMALLRNEDGVVASIEASWDEWKGYRFHVEAYGDRGMARAYYAPMMATVVRMDRPGGQKEGRAPLLSGIDPAREISRLAEHGHSNLSRGVRRFRGGGVRAAGLRPDRAGHRWAAGNPDRPCRLQ